MFPSSPEEPDEPEDPLEPLEPELPDVPSSPAGANITLTASLFDGFEPAAFVASYVFTPAPVDTATKFTVRIEASLPSALLIYNIPGCAASQKSPITIPSVLVLFT